LHFASTAKVRSGIVLVTFGKRGWKGRGILLGNGFTWLNARRRKEKTFEAISREGSGDSPHLNLQLGTDERERREGGKCISGSKNASLHFG